MSQQPQFKTAVERGCQALLSKSYAPALVSQGAYDRLWQQWSHAAPKDFKAAVLERYGLHEAPYQNDGFPMGLRKAPSATGDEIGVGYDCLLCHAGSINGQSLIGLGNSSLEWQSLFDELFESEGVPHGIPIPFSHVRGTTEAAAAIVHLMQIRDENLNFRLPVKIAFEGPICEDVPAWWLMKKKRHLYHPGSHPGESVRIGMAFLLHPLNRGEEIKNAEADYRDIREFILRLKASPYPFPINKNLAATGEGMFNKNCAACHGTYGENEQFPSKVVELSVIGTDPVLVEQFAVYAQEAYSKSWFGKEQSSDGRHFRREQPTASRLLPWMVSGRRLPISTTARSPLSAVYWILKVDLASSLAVFAQMAKDAIRLISGESIRRSMLLRYCLYPKFNNGECKTPRSVIDQTQDTRLGINIPRKIVRLSLSI